MARLRIGTRGSTLATVQAGDVARALGGAEIITIATSGDEGQSLADRSAETSTATETKRGRKHGGDKSRFVREIERALLEGEIDLAVHSAKDLPTELPDGLTLAGVPARLDPADAWVGSARSLEKVAPGCRIGTASVRRRSQLLAARPDLHVEELRGNVDSRLRKLGAGDVDALVLASAGLIRLGRDDEAAFALDPESMIPAAGQGALALEIRAGDQTAAAAASAITHEQSLIELTAERATIRGLEADCDTPVGVSARAEANGLVISAYVGTPDGHRWIRERVVGDLDQPVALADSLVARLETAGAREILAEAGA